MTDPKRIGDLIPDYFKSKTAFKKAGGKIFNSPTLFNNWDALKDFRCPHCLNRLALTANQKVYFCRGKKHFKRPFAIKSEKLQERISSTLARGSKEPS